MKALAVMKPGETQLVDIPVPAYGDYECLVRVRACGFCNCTDMEMIYNNHVNINFEYPFILGHEGSGEIVAVGSKVRNYKVGDRIVFPEGRTIQGGYRADSGHYCEYAVTRDFEAMREDQIDISHIDNELAFFPRVYPNEISFEDGGVLVPMRETYSAAKNIGIFKGAKVLIYGDGPNAFGLCAFSHILGASWVGVVGHWDGRLQHIKKNAPAELIINSHREEVDEVLKKQDVQLDFVIDTAGRSEILIKGSHQVKTGGKVVLYSGVKPEHSKLDLYAWANNVTFHKHFFPSGDLDAHDEVIQLILEKRVDPKNFYSHIVMLEDFDQAIQMTKSREAFKVVVSI